jgi:hypothetical protein
MLVANLKFSREVGAAKAGTGWFAGEDSYSLDRVRLVSVIQLGAVLG